MGTDIHMSVEVCRAVDPDDPTDKGYWETVGPIFKYGYYAPDRDYFWEEFTAEPYTGRNYDLFGWLANVRNGFGFAAVDTGDPVKPIAEGRGWPDNAWSDFRDQHKDDEGNYHSHSYVTLTELLAADWDAIKVHRMFVKPQDYWTFKKTGELPGSGWGSSSGPSVWEVTAAEYELMDSELQQKITGVQIQWETTVREAVGSFYTETIPALQDLMALPPLRQVRRWVGERGERIQTVKDVEPSTDQIRVIFCFDS